MVSTPAAQHPDVERFIATYKQRRFDAALAVIDDLIARHPGASGLRWQRVKCPEKLRRFAEIGPELDRLLQLKQDQGPAIVKRVQYLYLDRAGRKDADPSPDRGRQQLREWDAPLTANQGEAEALLDRAVSLAPTRVDLLSARGSLHQRAALGDGLGLADQYRVRTLSGTAYAHPRPEAALARYNEVLAELVPGDSRRAAILEMRARSENQGAGEREETARRLESAVAGDGKDRHLGEDMAAHLMFATANAIRAGKSVPEKLGARISEDSDTVLAISIAQQILNQANEPAPQLEAVDAKDYPGYQRASVKRVARKMEPLGLREIAPRGGQGSVPDLGAACAAPIVRGR